MVRLRRWFVGVVVFAMLAVVVPFGPSSQPAHAQTTATSFAADMMESAAKAAVGAAVGDLFGWVTGSGGSVNGDVEVLNEILDELDTIEDTLQGIETEIKDLDRAIKQLDCDTWVTNAETMVNAISNLWDPNSLSAGPGDPPPPQQSYVGIVAETKNNTVTLADMQAWVDQVLNNNGQGIDGKSIQDHLQDLSQALIAPAGGTGIIKSCLTAKNDPSNFDSETDDTYYDAVVGSLIGYYYVIQAQGMTMVMEALNFEAWQAAGSPISDSDDIENLPMTVCNGATGEVAEFCENASWVVLGTDGKSGVRGRVAAQLTLGGAPYTTNAESEFGVQLYTGSTNLWPRNVTDFAFTGNNSKGCKGTTTLDSNAPCGALVGSYLDPFPAGIAYFGYGALLGGFGGSWAPASGPQLSELLRGVESTAPFGSKYADVADYLIKERSFKALPSNIIFITSELNTYPIVPSRDPGDPTTSVGITFTDTGLKAPYHPIYDSMSTTSPDYYMSETADPKALTGFRYHISGESGSCNGDVYTYNNLPIPTLNGSFYIADLVLCDGSGLIELRTAPGWMPFGQKLAFSRPQYRMPVIDVSTLTCNTGLNPTNPAGAPSLCGNDQVAWLNGQVPPADDGAGLTLSGPDGAALVNAASLPGSIDAVVVSGDDGLESVTVDGSLLDVVSGDEIDVSIRLRRSGPGSWFRGHLRVRADRGWVTTPLKIHEDSIKAHEPDAYVRIELEQQIGKKGPQISGVITVKDFN